MSKHDADPTPVLPVDDPELFDLVRALVQQRYGRKALIVPEPDRLAGYGLIAQKRFVRATLWAWAPGGFDRAVAYLREVEDRIGSQRDLESQP